MMNIQNKVRLYINYLGKKTRKLFFIIVIMFGVFSCSTQKGLKAVNNFDKARYLGTWYEIARLDFKYERNLNNTTANYSLNTNGTIRVDNKGYNTKKGKYEQAIGKAKFAGNDDIAKLRVSFFGPFYSDYIVIALDPDYKYALVAGSSLKYLWILSRETSIPDEIKNKYLKIANDIGYNTPDLLWITHDKNE